MDVFLIAILGALTLAQGFIGFELGLHERPSTPKKQWFYRLLVLSIGIATVGFGAWQAKRNSKAQNQQQGELRDANSKTQGRLDQTKELLDQTQTKVDGLTFILQHQRKPLSAAEEAAIIKAYSRPGVPPAGTQTNGEIRGRAQMLISRMKDLMADTAAQQQELDVYWSTNPPRPDSADRHRVQEYNDMIANEQFRFQWTMLQEYVYLFQEIFSRTPADKLKAAGYGDKGGAEKGWLAALGIYRPNQDFNYLIDNLEQLLKVLPQ